MSLNNGSETESEQQVWVKVIGRSLAFLCLCESDFTNENIGTKAKFLDCLGLPKKDIANLLGTTEGSARELIRMASKKKGKNSVKK